MNNTGDTTADYSQIDEILDEITKISPFLTLEERPDFKDYVDRFGKLLPQWAEYSISPEKQGVGIMTRGVGSDFEDEVRDYLEKWGIEENALEVFDSIRKYFPDVNVLAKKDFNEKEELDFTFYWQHLVPVDGLLKVAGKYGISREVQDFFKEAALLLRSKSVFLGMEFHPPDITSFKIFFANPLRKSQSYIAPAIAALMTMMGLSADAVNHFIGFHNFLFPVAAGSVFTSLAFVDQPPCGLKLDYEIIPPGHAEQMMQALKYTREQQQRIRNVMKVLQMKRITYVGIKFLPGKKPTLKLYFDRRYSEKNKENADLLVDFIRSSIWTP